MSKEAAGLPTPVDAYNHLFDNVHAQVFFGKLANYGIQPTTEKEAADLLTIAGNLRHVANEKAASDSKFSGAVSALNNVVKDTPQQAAFTHQAIKQAAAELMQDASVYNSVLSLKAAEASALAGDN